MVVCLGGFRQSVFGTRPEAELQVAGGTVLLALDSFAAADRKAQEGARKLWRTFERQKRCGEVDNVVVTLRVRPRISQARAASRATVIRPPLGERRHHAERDDYISENFAPCQIAHSPKELQRPR